jgi:DNA-binding NtrC family response regulator
MARMLQEPEAQQSLDALIVSARPEHLKTLIRVLDACSARVVVAFSLRQAQGALSLQSFGLIFCDEYLSEGSYRDLLSAHIRPNGLKLVLMLCSGDWPEYIEAMQRGAFDVLRCPLQVAEVEGVVVRATTDPVAPRRPAPKAKTAAATLIL